MIATLDAIHLIHEHCDGFVEVRCLNQHEDIIDRAFLRPHDTDGLTRFMGTHLHHHLIFGIATRKDASSGKSDNCLHLPCLFVDSDFKHVPEPLVRQRLAEFPLHPSIIARSGGGLHSYLLLREPIALTPDSTPRVKTLLQRLAIAFGGDQQSAEPARCLRLFGSMNWKYTPPRQVEVEFVDERYRYELDDLDAFLPPLPQSHRNGGERFHVPSQIPDGERNSTLFRLARSLKTKGLAFSGMLAALRAENLERCMPPLDDEEVHKIVQSAMDQSDRPGYEPREYAQERPSAQTSGGESASEKGGPTNCDATTPAPILVPETALLGIGRDFADLYAQYLESPRGFFYFSFLTYLGSVIAKKVTLESELRPQPRLYTALLGESADARKSTALHKTDEFFRSLGEEYYPRVLFGVGSAEGIGAELTEHSDLLLHFDELKSFVDKARAEHSVALPMVSTLFERNDYDNRIKKESLSVRNASLSLLAACTVETYSNIFDQKFLAIGFPNRLWLVADRSTTRISIPKMIPETELGPLRMRVRAILDAIQMKYAKHGYRPVPYSFTPDAEAVYGDWYAQRQGSLFERRLDTYANRLMLLLAVTADRPVIDQEIATAVVALLKYQLDVRRECDPVDAESAVAVMEEKIRRTLARGPLKATDLKRKVHYSRPGLWVWNAATDNLKRADEVRYDPKTDQYALNVNTR